MRRNRIDLYHANSLAEGYPVIIPPGGKGPCQVVITVHDLIPLRFKGSLPHFWPKGRFAYHFGRKTKDLEKAEAIIAVSLATKRDILSHLSVDPEKVHVIYEAADPQYRMVENPTMIARVREKYRVPEKYVLYVGGFYDPRKNLPVLLDAFHRFRSEYGGEEYSLILAGSLPGENILLEIRRAVRERRLEGHVLLPGYVQDGDLPALYSGSALFVYPSLYEGFGLPVLEAMACGAPVIASNISSLPEVVGDAGILVDPASSKDIAAAMGRIVSEATLAMQLKERGLKRAAELSWERTALQTLEIYQKVYEA